MTWISLQEKLPAHGQRVIALNIGQDLPHTTTFFTNKFLTSAGYDVVNFMEVYDFWQPVPTREQA